MSLSVSLSRSRLESRCWKKELIRKEPEGVEREIEQCWEEES